MTSWFYDSLWHKTDGFIKVLDGKIKHLILSDYGLFDKICEKIKFIIRKKMVLQIVPIINLKRSELIHIILYLLKKNWLFIMLQNSVRQLGIRIKTTTSITYI